MKIVHFSIERKKQYGILDGDSISGIKGNPYGKITLSGTSYRLDEVKLLAPCMPSKIVALGANYKSHADEMKSSVPQAPLMFIKPSTAVIGPEDNIVYPSSSTRVDYECELGVVIKNRTSKVSVKDSLKHVLGYTCFNDVTARDLQNNDGQWTRAKGFDTFAAVGPCIETELDPRNVILETHLNGEIKQHTNTDDLIYTVPELINFVSHVMTLLPGDIIATGTPSGIGPMYPGDTVEIKIEPIGTLRNYVVKNGN